MLPASVRKTGCVSQIGHVVPAHFLGPREKLHRNINKALQETIKVPKVTLIVDETGRLK